jgi:hypothetical protein
MPLRLRVHRRSCRRVDQNKQPLVCPVNLKHDILLCHNEWECNYSVLCLCMPKPTALTAADAAKQVPTYTISCSYLPPATWNPDFHEW